MSSPLCIPARSGTRVLQVTDAGTTVYIGDHYEEFLSGVQASKAKPVGLAQNPSQNSKAEQASNLPSLSSASISAGKAPGWASPVHASRQAAATGPQTPALAVQLAYSIPIDDGDPAWSYPNGATVVSSGLAFGGTYRSTKLARLSIPANTTNVSVRFGPQQSKPGCNRDPVEEYPYRIRVDGQQVWSGENYPAWGELTFAVNPATSHVVEVIPWSLDCEGGRSPSAAFTIDAGSRRSADTTPPTPAVITAPLYARSGVTVTWSKAQDNPGGIGMLSCAVQHRNVVTTTWTDWQSCMNAGGKQFYADDGVYRFRSAAMDIARNTAYSALVTTTVDSRPPSMTSLNVPTDTTSSFVVSWSGEDNAGGSGIAYYDAQYQIDEGAWTDWLTRTLETQGTFSGESGHVYGFRVRAVDRAGNDSGWLASVGKAGVKKWLMWV